MAISIHLLESDLLETVFFTIFDIFDTEKSYLGVFFRPGWNS